VTDLHEARRTTDPHMLGRGYGNPRARHGSNSRRDEITPRAMPAVGIPCAIGSAIGVPLIALGGVAQARKNAI
jgi:hypothetical protein